MRVYIVFLLIIMCSTATAQDKEYESFKPKYSLINKRGYERDYFRKAFAMNNYYAGYLHSTKYTKSEKALSQDSLLSIIAHRYGAFNNHAIISYDFFRLKKKRIVGYDDSVAYLPLHALKLSPYSKKVKLLYPFSLISFENICYSDSIKFLPFIETFPIKKITKKLNNLEVKHWINNKIGNNARKLYLCEYNFHIYLSSINKDYSILPQFREGFPYNHTRISTDKLPALIDGSKQYYLSSWFYGYRNSCKELWFKYFSEIITSLDAFAVPELTKPEDPHYAYINVVKREHSMNQGVKYRSRGYSFFQFRTKKARKKFNKNELKIYEESTRIEVIKRKWRNRKDINKYINSQKGKEKVFQDIFIENVILPDSSIIQDYFMLILKHDFHPENIEFLKINKKIFKNKYPFNTGKMVKMTFYSQKWQRNFLLKFDLGEPYRYEIKKL